MRPASLIAALFIGLVALGHLLRLLLRLEVLVGGFRIPLWASGPAFLLLGALAAYLVWEERRTSSK